MKQKLLVFTSSFPRWKGDTAGSFVYELSKRLTRDLDISVLAPNCPGLKTGETVDGIKVHRFRYFFKRYEKLAGTAGILPTLRKNKWYYLQIPFFIAGEFFALRKQIKKQRPDIIHAHWIIPQGFIAALTKKIYGVPFLVTAHGSDVFALQGKLTSSVRRFTLKNADKITVVSSAMKNEILKKVNPNLKIEIISMGVDTNQFHPDKKDDSIKLQYGIHGPFLLFVGRLAPEKGVRYLIEAMTKTVKEFPKTKLLVIGKGTLEKELKDLTKKLNLGKNVVFTGEIANAELPKYYATADIFVNASLREGLPVALMEAMSSGAVTITTNLEGNKDLIVNRETGFLVERKSHTEISNKVIELLKDESLMAQIKKQARNKITKQFDWQIIANRYAGVLK